MEYFYIIGICIIIVVILFFLLREKTKKKYEEEYQRKVEEIAQNEVEKIKNITILQCKAETDKLEEIKKQIVNNEAKLSVKESTLTSLNSMIKQKENFNSSLQKIREEELNKLIEKEKEKRYIELNKEVEDWAQSAQEVANNEYLFIKQEYDNKLLLQKEELERLSNEIEDYRTKREAINQEILRSRALNEQQEFYRIQLKEEDKEDINYLISIIARFNNKETIYKLIWTEYLQKPFKLMLNRVLGGKDPKNVIYMIKNLNTQEIYIGKTKGDVSKRWTEHIKTSLNIGTISRSNIHKALFNHWDEYSFSIIEEVKNEDKLSERERYYINFYESNIYGYNIKSGG